MSDAAAASLEVVMPEVTALPARRSALSGKRLNLCIPSLVEEHAFGGIATALQFFDALSADFSNLRIIVTGAEGAPDELVARYANWQIASGADSDVDGRLILQGRDRWASIAVRRDDYFIGTAWWTARLARDLLRWQKAEYGIGFRRYAYLIQDYEPGFYSWSSRYALAEATYRRPEEIVAVFNTGLLREHFAHGGYDFDQVFAFEPQLNRQLAALRRQSARRTKDRTIMIYGRPGTPRNGFPLIVQALRAWARDYSCAADWRVVSAGEWHPAMPLGKGIEVAPLGKLSLEDYAIALDAAAIGISLMISPHPSYPPLEMAAFGMRVITNAYGVKNLSRAHSNIVSVAIAEPENISAELVRLCNAFASDPWTNRDGSFLDGAFLDERELFPFCENVLRALDTSPDTMSNDAPSIRI